LKSAICITGIGIVSPLGIGRERFWAALIEGRNALADSPRLREVGIPRGAEIRDFNLDDIVVARDARRMSVPAQCAVAATKLAFDDAHVALPPKQGRDADVGVFFATSHGSANFSAGYMDTLWEVGPTTASPALFAGSVHNAPASYISQVFGLVAASHTFLGAESAAVEALGTAALTVGEGMCSMAVAGTSHEICPAVILAYHKLGLTGPQTGTVAEVRPFQPGCNGFLPGEGAAFVCIETVEHAKARGARNMGVLKAVVGRGAAGECVCTPDHAPALMAETIRKCLDTAGLNVDDIGAVFSSGNSSRMDELVAEGLHAAFRGRTAALAVTALRSQLGEAFGTACMTDVACAAIAVSGLGERRDERTFDSILENPLRLSTVSCVPAGKPALVCAMNSDGGCGCIIVDRA
jgi:3-oxoacyl-[acyl-carrier-protein] synthase II